MQIDMHFYATYALARAAGLPPDTAKTVATAAQFVDDAVLDEPIKCANNAFFLPYITAHAMLSHKNVEHRDQWSIWVPFHFLPGNVGATADERLICRQVDPDAQGCPGMRVLKFAMDRKDEPYGAHLMGIVCHVLQDTFAHFGFSGISSEYNHIKQSSLRSLDEISESQQVITQTKFTGALAENTGLGHAAVGTLPDMPWLGWKYDYEYSADICPRQADYSVSRRNLDHFLSSTEFLYTQLLKFAGYTEEQAESNGGRSYAKISAYLHKAMDFSSPEPDDRSERWLRLMREQRFFDKTGSESIINIRYEDADWRPTAQNCADTRHSNAVLFNTAASVYLTFVTDDLLPGLGLTF